MSNLNGRVTRLEGAANQQLAERCCWHGPLVIYPSTLAWGANGQPLLPIFLPEW